ncbi:hypothetical protein K435DRAFT_811628 [Dendrothele bispora CBS 962.96]|uniref:Uncharacterized protein n=1 Tax=Dendrothele bispora (strain CBS 962.96) TaxID=1314807 RepID=A0A4S8KRG1_DENBC|nr:hypothetical protein K435DRAFT_811628 [Dendrothele bispora CBS 962.96]
MYESGEGLEPETGSGIGPDYRIERSDASKGRSTCLRTEILLVMSGLRTTLRILRDAPTNTSPSSPILQVASANRLIVGAALASFRRSTKFFVDESCSSLTFFRLSVQEAPPEIPKTSSLLFQLLELTTTTTRLRPCTFFELSSLDPEMQPSATSPQRRFLLALSHPFLPSATLNQTARSKLSLTTPTTTYTFNDYLAVLNHKSVFEMAYYKSTAQNPFGGLQAFLSDHRVLFSPSTLKTYQKEDLISLATRVKDIFGLVDAWTVNDKNELPLVIDRARLTVFRNLRGAYEPSIFDEDVELRSWVQEEEEKALDQGIAQLVSLSECKFSRPKTPFSTTTTSEDGEEVSIEPDHSAINFGPPKQGDKFYLAPPAATSRRNPFTGEAGTSTSKTPPLPPKPTRKSAFSGLETKNGAATPPSGTKVATGTRSAPGTTTLTRTTETVQKQPTKPAKTATKPATASKAPAKSSGGASKSSTPAPACPLVLVPRATIATRGATSTPSTTSTNTLKRTRDAISSEQESTPASNLRATKERAARSRTLPAIAVLEGSPEPPPAKKQRLVKTEPAPNAQASSSTSVARTKTKRKAMAGEDDRGRWHRHYNDFPHVNKLPEVNPQPNYPNAQSLILAKRNGIFANVDTDPAPELRVVEAMAAYTDRVVNGPYPWKCDQCNASRKVCVFRGHSKKCDACASARNSCSILQKGFKFFFHQEDAAGRVALAPSHMASEAQRARRLRHEADLLIDHAARLHYEADIMTAHNTVAVLQILKMSPDDKKLVDEYRKTDKDIRDIFDNVDEYRRVFDIVVNEFPDLRDPRFSLPSDSQMKSPKKKSAKPRAKATKKGKGKAVEPVEEEEEDVEQEPEDLEEEEEQEMEDPELERSASPAATEHIPSEDDGDNGEDTDNTYYPPKSQSEEEEIPPTGSDDDADGDQDSQQEEEDEEKVFDQLHSSPVRPSILDFDEEVEREDVVDEGAKQSAVDDILGRDAEEERETEEPPVEA